MRLLHTRHQVFKSFEGDSVPPYAILSHTWGSEEVTYQDAIAMIQRRNEDRDAAHEKKGFLKINLTCNQANYDGLEWVWIDTCNIDKTSSSELSEAINSMFQWYRRAAICYVYLEDINYEELEPSEGVVRQRVEVLRKARWFYRGWTLQELLASERIYFFGAAPENDQWLFIGSKESESKYLETITGIDRSVLDDPDLLPTVSVARRMSWAARRQTTRSEDIAYCLLGVFQVNMPLLYGEGANAFIRLQEEIIKNTEDESLFAWVQTEESQLNDGILATHPRAFIQSSKIVPYASKLEPYAMTNRGLRIEARTIPIDGLSIFCVLHCRYEDSYESSVAIPLQMDPSTGRYRRLRNKTLDGIRYDMATNASFASVKTIYIHKWAFFPKRKIRFCYLRECPQAQGFNFEAAIARNIEQDKSTKNAPGKSTIPWSMQHRALIASTADNGYFSALRFSRKGPSDHWSNIDSFIALLALPNKLEERQYFGARPGVFLTALPQAPDRSDLQLPLETGFKRITSCKSTLDVEDGTIIANLSKENKFGEDSFALDILFEPSMKQEDPAQAPPEVRIFDPQDDDITVRPILRAFGI
ncbi:HET-domain-containing protein [Periconia macrospinosa]|uniref:HET-domain-containing protein n=1 Tax=Periconia macrospinosa TaxID=97972 RepID=A0A2V1DYD3_9PLEO|nr:HET-domain-containing protein [Periconia macrospinosa]